MSRKNKIGPDGDPTYSCMEGCSIMGVVGGFMLVAAAKLTSNLIKNRKGS